MKNFRLQSAMEYLMTYGWAILIIAVVMVALFSLGILGGSPIGTTCLAQSGFQCSTPVLSHSTGGLSVTLGEIGSTWSSANVIFVPQGTAISPALFTAATNYAVPGGFSSGQLITANVPVVNGGTTIGASYAGALWVQFTTPSTSGFGYTEVATVTLKAS